MQSLRDGLRAHKFILILCFVGGIFSVINFVHKFHIFDLIVFIGILAIAVINIRFNIIDARFRRDFAKRYFAQRDNVDRDHYCHECGLLIEPIDGTVLVYVNDSSYHSACYKSRFHRPV